MSEISEKAKVRLLGGEGEKQTTSLSSAAAAQTVGPDNGGAAPSPQKSTNPVFLSDSAEGADLLDAALVVQPLAQLCVAEQVETPFLAALTGSPGSGKTFALKRLGQRPGPLGDAALKCSTSGHKGPPAGPRCSFARCSSIKASSDS